GLGHGAADDRVLDPRGVDPGGLRDYAAQYVRQHLVGAGVAEHAARGLAHRGAGGGDDVGVLYLAGHGSQFLSGLPVFNMCSMRAWVFGICASATKCSRSSRSSQSSSTTEWRSTSPPHSTVAMRSAISWSCAEMNRPSSMFTSILRKVAMPTSPAPRLRRAG